MLADAEARTLRNLFAAEADILSIPFAAKLKTFLEQHIGLRVFYPEIANFYRDVQSGRIEEPLPLDAVDGFINGVKANTPLVFESSVQDAIEGSAASIPGPIPASSDSPHILEPAPPLPPKDPLGELDSRKAGDFTFAGAANGVWRAFLEGYKVHRAVEGWKKTSDALLPHIQEILQWLHHFVNSSNGAPRRILSP
jgi:hypothetical protein